MELAVTLFLGAWIFLWGLISCRAFKKEIEAQEEQE